MHGNECNQQYLARVKRKEGPPAKSERDLLKEAAKSKPGNIGLGRGVHGDARPC